HDPKTPIATINVLYDVGARDENPDRTGFAHLFEHLMFGGSKHIPSYDEPLERAGGENNAFTNNDITNYYLTLPVVNLETGFWLESDRMLELAFSDKSLEVQKNVVSEEFRQRYLNQPYGDVMALLRKLAYEVHPYQWPTIGRNIDHIVDASMSDVRDFFEHHYAPNNAVVAVGGDVKTEEVRNLANKWFGSIPERNVKERNLPAEPPQNEKRFKKVTRKVPADAIYMAFHMSARQSKLFYVTDLISDILSNGKSSRLFQKLVVEKQMFSELDAFVTGDQDPGLFIIAGKLHEKQNIDIAYEAIMNELYDMSEYVEERELQKVKNKFEANFYYSLTRVLSKTMNLAYFELLGDARDWLREIDLYHAVTVNDIKNMAKQLFDVSNQSVVYYLSEK
ncbi:MAG: M16 family metallopeptidase, partial [Bacteroidota bacterium]